ncbi:MAG: hypothetical protein ABEJ77_01795 [Halanaeroarchaeum sp.]
MSVESAIFVDDLETLDAVDRDVDRLYYGNEFCDKRLPDPDDVVAALDRADREGLSFTYVTPILTPTKVEALDAILDRLEAAGGADELVFNDWGAYAMTEGRSVGEPVAGRVLSRQKRDPTVEHLTGETDVPLRADGSAVAETTLEHFQKSVLNASYARDHFRRRGVDRVELDVLTQGIFDEDVDLGASLYHPWNYVTVKRWCHESTTAPLCNEACEDTVYTLDNRPVMPRKLYRHNNVVFCYTEDVPEVSSVDRSVFVPEPIN